MSELAAVDLDSAIKSELATEHGIAEEGDHVSDVTQGLWHDMILPKKSHTRLESACVYECV